MGILANVSCDCPPGEVCNRQSRLCSAPPTTCYFNEQCPCGEDGWFCNTNQTCIDSGIIARCTKDSDCDDTPGCDLGCVCFDGGCIPQGQCDPTGDIVAQCGAGNYCAGSADPPWRESGERGLAARIGARLDRVTWPA